MEYTIGEAAMVQTAFKQEYAQGKILPMEGGGHYHSYQTAFVRKVCGENTLAAIVCSLFL